MSDAKQVKDRLQGQIESVCHYLFPSGKKKGKEFAVGSISGDPGSSLLINLTTGKAGVWKDFATGETGDIYQLWMAARNVTFAEAFEECAKYVGFSRIERPKPKPKPQKPSTAGLVAIKKSPAMDYIQNTRGISEDTARLYKVFTHGKGAVRIDKNGASPDFFFEHNEHFVVFSFIDSVGDPVMLKSTGIKKKADGKKDIWSTRPYYTLWGWWLVTPDTRAIVITEGEWDAMSVHQLDPGMPVLSMPAGTSNLDWIDNDYDALCRFETIYICTDQDESGDQAAMKIAKRLGLTRCKRLPLPAEMKDANQALMEAEPDDLEIYNWFAAAFTYDPPALQGIAMHRLAAHELLERRKAEDKGETTFLWPELGFNFSPGQTTLLTGYKGHGKSEMVYQLHLAEMAAGRKCCIASFEIPPDQMLLNLSTQLIGRFPTHKEFDVCLDWFDGRLWFYGARGQQKQWRPFLEDFGYCAQRFGCELFVVDSLHFCTQKEDYQSQDAFSVDLTNFADAHKVHATLIAHSAIKKGEHLVPQPEHVLGSSGILVPMHNVMSVWRNKEKVEIMEAAREADDVVSMSKAQALHDGVIALKFRRDNGKLWTRKVWFNPESKTFRIEQADIHKPFLDPANPEKEEF